MNPEGTGAESNPISQLRLIDRRPMESFHCTMKTDHVTSYDLRNFLGPVCNMHRAWNDVMNGDVTPVRQRSFGCKSDACTRHGIIGS
jgi:hypothetical protein